MKVSSYSQNGQLQLNAFSPFILKALLETFASAGKAAGSLALFFEKMEIDAGKMEENLTASPALLNSLLPVLGYHKIKEIYPKIMGSKPKTIKDWITIVSEFTNVSKSELELLLDPGRLTSSLKE
jgi:aspartate ammonia-lyase